MWQPTRVAGTPSPSFQGRYPPRRMRSQLLVLNFLLVHSALASNNFYGIDISSFNSHGQCRNEGPFPNGYPMHELYPLYPLAQWDSIVANAKKTGYKRFRIYGNDCGIYDLSFMVDPGVQINLFYNRHNF